MKEKGQVLIEFVIIFPIFLVLLIAGVEMYVAFDTRSILSSAVREGAALSASGVPDADVIQEVVDQTGIPATDVTITYTDEDGDGVNDHVTVSAHDSVRLAGGEIFLSMGLPPVDVSLDPSFKQKIKPAPGGSADPFDNDVLLADDLPVGDHVWGWLGAYERDPVCNDAVLFVAAQTTTALASSYDLVAVFSDDGVTPGSSSSIGTFPAGAAGTWRVTRRASTTSPSDGLNGTWNEGSQAWVMLRAFANAPMRFTAQAHCTRTLP